MKAILCFSLTALVFLSSPATLLRADDTASLLDAARKAAAKNDVAGATEKFDQALKATPSADRKYASVAVEFSTFLRKNKANERAVTMLKTAADQQKTAAPIERVSVLMALAEAQVAAQSAADFETTEAELVKVWSAAIGPDAPVVANNQVRLAQIYMRNGKFAEAATTAAQAVASLKKSYPADSAAVGNALTVLTQAQGRSGKQAEALETAKAAREIMSKTLDPKARPAGAGVTPPKIVKRVEPEYTEAARKARIQGSITLSLTVDEEGNAKNVVVLMPLGAGLDEKAIAAVSSWKFDPGLKNDEPVAVRSVVEVNLKLL